MLWNRFVDGLLLFNFIFEASRDSFSIKLYKAIYEFQGIIWIFSFQFVQEAVFFYVACVIQWNFYASRNIFIVEFINFMI